MSLKRFVPDDPATDRSLVVLNGDAPNPVRAMLVDLFDDQPVEVETDEIPEYEEDTVVLLEDGEIVASSPLAALRDAVLLVNSDLFVTGTRSLDEIEVPEVLAGLTDTPFSLRGYPESNTEKLLLILVSRFVERRAAEAGAGTLRASFQYLSRVDDEQGTRAVYETLAGSDLDVHLYGVPDWIPSRELDVITHAGRTEDFERAWFVLFEPERSEIEQPQAGDGSADDEPEPIGLLAYETEPRQWAGFYSTDATRLGEIGEYIRRRM